MMMSGYERTRRTIEFDGLRFFAEVGPDDWYKGEIAVRPDEGAIDFMIEDCFCGYRGESSDAIYRWEGDTLILATPQPGSPRPTVFNEDSGQVGDAHHGGHRGHLHRATRSGVCSSHWTWRATASTK